MCELERKIEWIAFTEDVELECKQADIVLNFSESESFSITCLEALYFGRPLIATDCGGPAEIIDFDTGYLVNLGDVKAMTQSLEYLITHPSEREEMSRQAYSRVRSKFSYENTINKLELLYGNLVNGKG